MPIGFEFEELPFGTTNKRGESRIRFSNFMITMNTNVRMSDAQAVEMGQDLYKAIRRVFPDQEGVERFIDWKTGGPADIERIKVTSKGEVGHNSKGSRLHFHVGVKIAHRAKIQLKIPDIEQSVNAVLRELGAPYLVLNTHVSVFRSEISDYLSI